MDFYILDDEHQPVKVDSLVWAAWRESDRTRKKSQVGLDQLESAVISTVFLGLDHNWRGGLPILFETMVFASVPEHDVDQHMWRYSTWDEAVAGHKAAVRLCKELDAAIQAEAGVHVKELLAKLKVKPT